LAVFGAWIQLKNLVGGKGYKLYWLTNKRYSARWFDWAENEVAPTFTERDKGEQA